LDKDTLNENFNFKYSVEPNEINENFIHTDQNNLNFWKNMDEDLIGNKLFPDEKIESIYADKQAKFTFDKNSNRRTYSDLRNNYGK